MIEWKKEKRQWSRRNAAEKEQPFMSRPYGLVRVEGKVATFGQLSYRA